MDGFAFAAEALCGRYYGARDREKFHRALRGVWQWALRLVVVYTIAYMFGSPLFTRILTTDTVVREAATDYYIWAMLIPISGVAAFVWDGVFVGITNTIGMLKGTMGGAIAFFLVYMLLADRMGNHALWLAFDVYLFMRGVVQHVIYIMDNSKFKMQN
jgi:MATE family multidrug resistance protein